MDLFATQCPWWLGGILLGAISAGLQWADNLPFGATGTFVAVTDWARTPSAGPSWRVLMFGGILLGAALHALAAGRLHPSLAHGGFDALWGPSIATKALVLGGAGLLMGFGARTADPDSSSTPRRGTSPNRPRPRHWRSPASRSRSSCAAGPRGAPSPASPPCARSLPASRPDRLGRDGGELSDIVGESR